MTDTTQSESYYKNLMNLIEQVDSGNLCTLLERSNRLLDKIIHPKSAYMICYLALEKAYPDDLRALLKILERLLDKIIGHESAPRVCVLILWKANSWDLLKVLKTLERLLDKIIDPEGASKVCMEALKKATEKNLLEVLKTLERLLDKIIYPKGASKVCIEALKKATEKNLLEVLKALNEQLSKITDPYYAHWVCELALGKATEENLPEVLKALEEPLRYITDHIHAYFVCNQAFGKATEKTLSEALKALEGPLGNIIPSYDNVRTLRDIIKSKLQGQELRYQCLETLNSNIGKHVEKGFQQEDALIRVVAGLGVLGCQYFMVTNPICYAGIMGANFLGHVISASISNDYEHANRAVFRGCTSTLLMIGLLYGGVGLAPMAGVLAVYEIVFNQIDLNNFNIAKRLSDGIADTLKLNNHMQDARSYVGEYLKYINQTFTNIITL